LYSDFFTEEHTFCTSLIDRVSFIAVVNICVYLCVVIFRLYCDLNGSYCYDDI
jgi:hypothetical protein